MKLSTTIKVQVINVVQYCCVIGFAALLLIGCLFTKLDLSTPEKTLAYYIESLRKGDLKGVLTCYEKDRFSLPSPIPIESFKIIKKTVLTKSDIEKLDFWPSPKVNDVELQVKETFPDGEDTYTYYLRFKKNRWRIYSHYSWSDDS